MQYLFVIDNYITYKKSIESLVLKQYKSKVFFSKIKIKIPEKMHFF